MTTNSVEADLAKIAKVGRGKRDLILIAAFVGVAGLTAWVAGGFSGSNVSRGAEAMTAPVPPATWHVPTPPPAKVEPPKAWRVTQPPQTP